MSMAVAFDTRSKPKFGGTPCPAKRTAQFLTLKLTAQQQQLLLTAMDRGGNPHERDTAAAFFFRELRKQFPDGHGLLATFGNGSAPPARSRLWIHLHAIRKA